jgi:SNF2 family DNA or RNA helicase
MFTGTLKPYQVDAVEKMVAQKKVLVAYEMGLGKTPMTIAAVETLRNDKHITKTVLVICLASLKYQWQKEVANFSDSVALVIDGTPAQRQKQYATMQDYQYMVMNYETVVRDWEVIKKFSFDAIVIDEATAIKSFKAKRAKRVKELGSRVKVKFALTGTPIENGRPEELYSIMEFIDRNILGRFDLFDKAFIVRNHWGQILAYRNFRTLHKVLLEHAVRKSQKDEDVAPYLPDAVIREPIIVPLDKEGQALYDRMAAYLLELLYEAQETYGPQFSIEAHYGKRWDGDNQYDELFGYIMRAIQILRMLCSTPKLLQNSYTEYETSKGESGSEFIHDYVGNQVFDLFKSPKIDAVVSYLQDHLDIDPTYKAVIFSNYKAGVYEVLRRLEVSGIKAVGYTGALNAKKKEEAKVAFQTTPDIRVFVSSDAGGYGVDLPQANLLINLDQPWSSGMAVQRNARINRASSTWPTITIQDFLIKDSIEQRQYETLKLKKSVANAILDGKGINSKGGVDITVGSLIDFLTAKLI